jgi:type II secretion system protein H
MPCRSINQTRSGFTLIEVLCVVAIFAIAAAIVFGEMSSQGNLQAESGARQVMADLLYAQNQAIATAQPVYVYFNTGGSTYSLYQTWGTCLTNPISQHNYSTSWSSGSWSVSSVALDATAKQPAMYFDALGTPWSCSNTGSNGTQFSTTGSIIITSNGSNSTITIQPGTGNITVQ